MEKGNLLGREMADDKVVNLVRIRTGCNQRNWGWAIYSSQFIVDTFVDLLNDYLRAA